MDLIPLQDCGCCEGRGVQWVIWGGARPPHENSLPLFDLLGLWHTWSLVKRLLTDNFISYIGLQTIILLGWKSFELALCHLWLRSHHIELCHGIMVHCAQRQKELSILRMLLLPRSLI